MQRLHSPHASSARQPVFRALGPTLAAAMLIVAPMAHAQLTAGNCGPLQNGYGPIDFRTAEKHEITIVTDHHFTPQVESLIRGNASPLGGDLDYTLRAIPNHPRALLSMMRYGERLKVPKVPHARYDVECYLVRAVTFRPADTHVRMLFAQFLNGNGRREEALAHLAAARQHAGENPFTHYNLGLFYLEVGEFTLAREQALRARELGFPRPDLIKRLRAAGEWIEPAEMPAAADAPASSVSRATHTPEAGGADSR